MRLPILLYIFLLLICACTENQQSSNPSASAGNGYYNAIIEIPTGTNVKIEFDYALNAFVPDQENGKDRVIKYLGYPGNYGFVPSTIMDPKQGGDGDAVDVLILGEPLAIGSKIKFIPIGVLSMLDDGERDDKIIGVPYEASLNIMDITSLKELDEKCIGCREIINTWFKNYNLKDEVLMQGWGDENEARRIINQYISQ